MRRSGDEKNMKKNSKVFKIHGHHDISHSYLIVNGNRSIVVDCGSQEMIKRLLKAVEENGLSSKDIYMVVVSHTHYDHTRGLKDLKEKYFQQAKIFVHENEMKCLTEGYSKIPPSTRSSQSSSNNNSEYNHFPPVSYDIFMKKNVNGFYDLNTSEFNNLNGKIIWTPGHSSGSICILVDDEIIVGDSCEGFYDSLFVSFAEDLPLLMKSWKKLLDLKGDVKWLHPGHGSTSSVEILKKEYEKYSKIYTN